MLKKTLLVAALVAACTGVHAQSTPAKKELVARILKIQQPGIEAMARDLAKQPATELMANAVDYLQTQVPADKRDAMAKGLQQDADKYMNETYPMVRDRALKLAPTTVGPLLEEKFSEDELKQVVAMMESPVYLKFQGLGGDMQRVLVNKLVPELKPEVAPRLRALDEAFAKRLGVQASAAAAPAPAPAAAARPAPKK
ncbi:MAG TPA: hypothetical protein VIL30_07255 [Ramlibacter sp.]|jgi:hypothetical protein